MIKNTVINAELGYALATARHKDAIVICDANMPIPDGCNVIDVSLMLCIKRFSRSCRSCLAEPSARIA